MFKKSLLLFALVLCAGVAHADDSSFPRIDVKGIAPGPLKENQKISFYGQNAADFMKMLPAVISVDPKQDVIDAKHQRQLTLVSKGLALQITCANATMNDSSTWVANPQGTQCDLQISKSGDMEGDSFEFKPKDALKK